MPRRETVKPKGGRAQFILERMSAALARGRHAEASRLFKEGQSCRAIPADEHLFDWLGKSVGKRGTTLLVRAFAETPCFFCSKGRESCERCDAKGYLGAAMVCEPCLGLGTTRCAYCDGSGWVGVDYVPAVLRLQVLTLRTKAAIERLKALVRQPLSEPTRRNCRTSLKQNGGALLVANSILGTFENIITAIRRFDQLPPKEESRANTLVDTCVRTTTRADRYVRETLKRMAVAVRFMAQLAARDSDEQPLAASRAEYYDHLVGSDHYSGTFLDHPFLREAVSQAQEGKEKKRASG